MKMLIAILVMCASAFAGECHAFGGLHLVDPPTTVYCRHRGVTIWAVTYEPADGNLYVRDRTHSVVSYFPLALDRKFRGLLSSSGPQDAPWMINYTLKTGFMDAHYWLNVELTGNY